MTQLEMEEVPLPEQKNRFNFRNRKHWIKNHRCTVVAVIISAVIIVTISATLGKFLSKEKSDSLEKQLNLPNLIFTDCTKNSEILSNSILKNLDLSNKRCIKSDQQNPSNGRKLVKLLDHRASELKFLENIVCLDCEIEKTISDESAIGMVENQSNEPVTIKNSIIVNSKIINLNIENSQIYNTTINETDLINSVISHTNVENYSYLDSVCLYKSKLGQYGIEISDSIFYEITDFMNQKVEISQAENDEEVETSNYDYYFNRSNYLTINSVETIDAKICSENPDQLDSLIAKNVINDEFYEY